MYLDAMVYHVFSSGSLYQQTGLRGETFHRFCLAPGFYLSAGGLPVHDAVAAPGYRVRLVRGARGPAGPAPADRSPNTGLVNTGFRNYADYMLTADFRAAAAAVEELAGPLLFAGGAPWFPARPQSPACKHRVLT